LIKRIVSQGENQRGFKVHCTREARRKHMRLIRTSAYLFGSLPVFRFGLGLVSIIACTAEPTNTAPDADVADSGVSQDASEARRGSFQLPGPVMRPPTFMASQPVIPDAGVTADAAIVDAGEKEAYPYDNVLSLEHLQARGTHNSYHLEPAFPVHGSHRYSHVTLDRQLEEQGVRAFEIDVHRDLFGEDLSVFHISIIDQETTCSAFVDCLSVIKSWSDSHSDHVPIAVWLEPKDDAGGGIFSNLEQFDIDIRSVFDSSQLVTPDDVRGSFVSVKEALRQNGWPKLAQIRGKIIFMLLEAGDLRDEYMRNVGDLTGRVMFPRADPHEFGESWAAVAKLNDPRAMGDIMQARAEHVLVASNLCLADASDQECTERREAGFLNGVQMLMDDFPAPVSSRSYWLEIPDSQPVRCNPQTAPSVCEASFLEDLP
jgi:hypothetical protein